MTTDTEVRTDVKTRCSVANILKSGCALARAGTKAVVGGRVSKYGIARVDASGVVERACSAVAERLRSSCIGVHEVHQYTSYSVRALLLRIIFLNRRLRLGSLRSRKPSLLSPSEIEDGL